jgi:hypothetical protein
MEKETAMNDNRVTVTDIPFRRMILILPVLMPVSASEAAPCCHAVMLTGNSFDDDSPEG